MSVPFSGDIVCANELPARELANDNLERPAPARDLGSTPPMEPA